jgi:alanine-synthesizing transaminase
VTAEHVFIGNGVSELIDLTLRALLNAGDEVLIPSPDYPLWTAAVTLNRARPVHYPCPPDKLFQPDVDALERLITDRTRALVIINPNNPTGAVYSREVLEAMVALAERHDLVVFSDEIYDGMVYDDAEFIPIAPLVKNTLCGTFGGLSKVYRACGFRVGWVAFSGTNELAKDYLHGLDLLASLRLCSNVPGQWGVQTALGGYQSLKELVRPGGRLYESRQAVIKGVEASEYLTLVVPRGSMYAFVGADASKLRGFDDQDFAMELLKTQHVLVAPGSSFNVDYRNYFRITILPEAHIIDDVFQRMEKVLRDTRHSPTP